MAKTNVNGINTQELLNIYENLSIRQLAEAVELSYAMLIKVKTTPIIGAVYDPTAVNFEALDKYINERVSPEFLADIDWEAHNQGRPSKAQNFDMSQFAPVDTKVYFKDDENEYTTRYATETHICLQVGDTTELTIKSAASMKRLGATLQAPTETNPAPQA